MTFCFDQTSELSVFVKETYKIKKIDQSFLFCLKLSENYLQRIHIKFRERIFSFHFLISFSCSRVEYTSKTHRQSFSFLNSHSHFPKTMFYFLQ